MLYIAPRLLIAAGLTVAAGACAPVAHTAPPAPAAFAEAAMERGGGDILIARVEGLQDAACAQAVRDKAAAEDAVLRVYVYPERGEVRIDLKPGKTMTETQIADLMTSAGCSLIALDPNAAK